MPIMRHTLYLLKERINMIKYAKIANEITKQVNIGEGSDIAFYISIGMVEMEVEQAYNGSWYVKGYAPIKPLPTLEERIVELEAQYQMNRWQREAILAEDSQYTEYTKNKAREIEKLAEQLRKQL